MTEQSKKNLLIVDDEPSMRLLLQEIFRKEDLNISLACDGIEAMNLVQKQKPDVVLLDIMMPGADGFQVCRRIRELYNHDSVFIIMFTALAGSRSEEEARRAGADHYINKPFNLGLLREIVKNNLYPKDQHAQKL